jgi:hypothetical protein
LCEIDQIGAAEMPPFLLVEAFAKIRDSGGTDLKGSEG